MCYSRTQLAGIFTLLALLGAVAPATDARAQRQGGYRFNVAGQRTVGYVDLGSQLVWIGLRCERSLPFDRIQINGGTTTIDVSDRSTSPELPPIEERVTLEITANRGTMTIDADYLQQPVVLSLRIQRLGQPPCR